MKDLKENQEKRTRILPGDIVYRFSFYPKTGELKREVLEILTIGTFQMKARRYVDGMPEKVIYFAIRDFFSVTSHGSSRFVILDEDDPEKAVRLVKGSVDERLAELEKQAERQAETSKQLMELLLDIIDEKIEAAGKDGDLK